CYRGAEDLLTLTALSTLVSEQGKKIGCLESELQAHKLLFKDVMGKLVKRVKFLESKLKARGRNVILSESDKEEDEEQDVDSLIKLAKAAAIAADTSSVPADVAQATKFPPSSFIPTDAFVHGNDVPTGTASDISADPSNKGKSPMVEDDPPIKERSFRQIEEDRLGAEAARKLYEEEQAELARSYFDLASWYNNQDKVVMGNNVYTVGDRVKLGLQLKLRILWRKNKQRIKADHFTRYGSAEEARNHLPPKKVWGDRLEDEWNNLVDWWSHPDWVARSLQNAANRAKNTILTHQGKKSFAQGRNEYKSHYEDLIETWRKTHSRPKTGEFKTEKNRKRYLDMKSMQDQVRAGVIPYKTDQDILDEVVPSTNRQNMSGKGRKLPGGGSTSRRRGPQAFPDAISREELDRILRQKDQEAELLRKQTAEAQQRAYLAALKADAAYQNSETMYGAIGEYFSNYAPNPTRPFMPPAFARPTMPQLSPEWAHLLNPPFPYNQPLQPSYAGPSQYTGPPGYTGPPRYPAPLQPLQPPYVGQFPFTPVNNNTFNNCYNPVMNSNLASTSNSQLPRFITNPHNNDTRSVDELARDRELAGEDNDVGDNNEEGDNQQSGGDYSEDEEGDNEEVQNESEESD
ncbi:JmjC domain-containing protein, partial [Tanacetum coccineum]